MLARAGGKDLVTIACHKSGQAGPEKRVAFPPGKWQFPGSLSFGAAVAQG